MRFVVVLCLAVSVALFSASQSRAESSGFSAVIDDLPLMQGLVEVGDGVEFSTPSGRLAEIITEGSVSRAEVEAFYASTLPQLGWVKESTDMFVREDESLSLAFEQMGNTLRVRFTLAPLASGQKTPAKK
jgi:hypothetical protein